MEPKNVKISYELFMKLLRYHLMDEDEYEEDIRRELEKKLNSMVMHDLYTRSKTAQSDPEREEARHEYLDRRGVPDDFRWGFSSDE